MKKLILLFVSFLSSVCYGQLANPTGTIIDSDGTAWFNAQVKADFVPSPAYPNINQYTVNGQPLVGNYDIYLHQAVTADNAGHFSINVLDPNSVSPSGSTYKFTIQSYTSSQASVLPNFVPPSGTHDVSAFINANITAPRFPATTNPFGGAFGYGINEISVIPVPGGSFFNVSTGTVQVWGCTSGTPNPTCAWQSQTIGSFCATTTCNISVALYSPNINNICETSLQSGSDFVAQINSCLHQSYMATGGMVTSYGYGNSTQTATTLLASPGSPSDTHTLGSPTQPIAWIPNPATKFIWNQAVGTTNAASSCIVPIAASSKITTLGFVTFSKVNMQLGPNAILNDFFCNATWDGTQEAMQIDGVTIAGDPNATKTGALLHLVNLFAGTKISNFSTYYPYGVAVQVDSGSDIVFDSSVVNDSAQSGQYPGATFVLNCPNRFTYRDGAIQDNGLFNPLMIVNSPNSGVCTSQGGGSVQPFGTHFYNTDFEIQPATVGSFTGHATDVTPIQLNDPADLLIDGLLLYGNRGAGQVNIVKITSNNGPRGPVEIDNLMAPTPIWGASDVLIKNVGGTFTTVAPQLQNVHGIASGGVVSIGKYRWQGSGASNGNTSIDYEDVKNFTSTTTNQLNVVPTIFSNIPICNSSTEGQIQSVTDSTVQIPGQIITTGGGTFHVSAYCNSITWAVASGTSSRLSQSFTICASGCDYNTTICTTNGSTGWAGGGCSMGVVNWPIPFVDNNYAHYCQVVTPLLGGGQPIAAFYYNQGTTNQTAVGIQVSIMTPTATAVQVQKIECLGVHN